MKKTIIAAVTGIIFGFIGCITAIVKIFSKLCEAPAIRDEIVKSLKNLITVSMYGNNGSYRPYMSYYNYNVRWDSKYTDDVIRTIRSVEFKNQSDSDRVLNRIHNTLKEFGHISVAEVYSLMSEYSGKVIFSKYIDTRYGWNNDTSCNFWQSYDGTIKALRPVKLAITEASI